MNKKQIIPMLIIALLIAFISNVSQFDTKCSVEDYEVDTYKECVWYLDWAREDEEEMYDDFKNEFLGYESKIAKKNQWKQYVVAVLLEHGYLKDKIDEIAEMGYWKEDYVPPYGNAENTVTVFLVDDSGNEISWKMTVATMRHYYSTAYNGIVTNGYTPSTCKISNKKIPLKEYGPDSVIQQMMYEDLLESIDTGYGYFAGESLTIDKTNSIWKNANERENDVVIVNHNEIIATDVEDYYAKGGYAGYLKRQNDESKPDDTEKKDDKTTSDKDKSSKDSTKDNSKDDKSSSNPPAQQHAHDYEQIIDPATCDQEGLITYKCECGDTYTEVIPKLEHDWVEERVEPTCKEPGYVKRVCGNCGIEEVEELPLADHDWEIIEQKDSTCSEEGYIKYICNVCGEEDISTISVKEHSWEQTAMKDPTCDEEGYVEYTCSECGESKRETIAPEGHAPYVETKNNKVLTVCSKCGEVLSEKEVDKSTSSRSLIIALIVVAVVAGCGITVFIIKKRR